MEYDRQFSNDGLLKFVRRLICFFAVGSNYSGINYNYSNSILTTLSCKTEDIIVLKVYTIALNN